jgi:hypothetical protein
MVVRYHRGVWSASPGALLFGPPYRLGEYGMREMPEFFETLTLCQLWFWRVLSEILTFGGSRAQNI